MAEKEIEKEEALEVPIVLKNTGAAVSEKAPGVVAPSTDWEERLRLLEAEKSELFDRLARKQADLENYRKRQEKERIEANHRAQAALLHEILPALDACERALETLTTQATEAGLSSYRQGLELIYKQLKNSMDKLGVQEMRTVGVKFDPTIHEAVLREETDRFQDHEIVEELQRGYYFKGKLLRPARVKVAVAPRGENPPLQ
ncbi:MAG: nucleotide exchange factor GrpE [Acidobacteria bacterium]|nr:nucleotide exchange factor GrpE [Acidobacteriota bacterium]